MIFLRIGLDISDAKICGVEIKLAMYNIILILVYLEPRQAYIGSIVVAIRCNVFECR